MRLHGKIVVVGGGGQQPGDCRDHVIGPDGGLWRLVVATLPHR